MPKLKKYKYPETELLNWMRFMNAEKKEEFEMLAKDNEYMEKAYEKLTELSADEIKRLEYEAREKAIRDHNWQMKTSLRNGYNKGYKSGYDSGYGSGYDNGFEEGVVKSFIEMSQEYIGTREDVLQRLMRKYSFEEAKAEEYMQKYWKIDCEE